MEIPKLYTIIYKIRLSSNETLGATLSEYKVIEISTNDLSFSGLNRFFSTVLRPSLLLPVTTKPQFCLHINMTLMCEALNFEASIVHTSETRAQYSANPQCYQLPQRD